MSREIRFRAWDIEEKQYFYNAEETYDYQCGGSGCYSGSFGEVLDNPDRFIVEQYTGLKDCNGKEIYEGDILKCPLGEEFGNMVVIYNDEFGMYEFQDKNNETPTCADFSHYGSGGEQEVIGNIHENKELLK